VLGQFIECSVVYAPIRECPRLEDHDFFFVKNCTYAYKCDLHTCKYSVILYMFSFVAEGVV
jgi:hypothetical protein